MRARVGGSSESHLLLLTHAHIDPRLYTPLTCTLTVMLTYIHLEHTRILTCSHALTHSPHTVHLCTHAYRCSHMLSHTYALNAHTHSLIHTRTLTRAHNLHSHTCPHLHPPSRIHAYTRPQHSTRTHSYTLTDTYPVRAHTLTHTPSARRLSLEGTSGLSTRREPG